MSEEDGLGLWEDHAVIHHREMAYSGDRAIDFVADGQKHRVAERLAKTLWKNADQWLIVRLTRKQEPTTPTDPYAVFMDGPDQMLIARLEVNRVETRNHVMYSAPTVSAWLAESDNVEDVLAVAGKEVFKRLKNWFKRGNY